MAVGPLRDAPTTHRSSNILEFINARYSDPEIDLERAAVAVSLSRFHLTRVLKRETGFGFSHHLRAVRVARAGELILTGRLSVKEVAALVGYSSTNALDRNFSRVYGVTPTAYRDTVGRHAWRA
jgi:transcriptional regulator GlxA family with amidase domain